MWEGWKSMEGLSKGSIAMLSTVLDEDMTGDAAADSTAVNAGRATHLPVGSPARLPGEEPVNVEWRELMMMEGGPTHESVADDNGAKRLRGGRE